MMKTASAQESLRDRTDNPAVMAGASLTFRSGTRSAPALGSTADTGISALAFLTTLAADLSKGPVDLPCFPVVVIKIREALSSPSTTPQDLLKLVGTEPRLAVRLIQMANSAAMNPAGNRVTELRTAIARLGQQTVQGTALSFAMAQMKQAPSLQPISGALGALWKRSIAVASISQVIARRTKVQADEAFLAGLLHGIGRLYIMARVLGHAGRVDQGEATLGLINEWHPSIGKAVLENWNLSEAVADAVSEQNNHERSSRRPPDLTDILIVSVALAESLDDATVIEPGSITSFQTIGMTALDCSTTLTHAQHQLGSLHAALGC